MNIKDEWRLTFDRLGKEFANRPSLRSRVLDRIDECSPYELPEASLHLRRTARRFPSWAAAALVGFVVLACGSLACVVALRSAHPTFNVIERPLPSGDLVVSLQLTARQYTGKTVVSEQSVTMRVSPRTGRAQPTNISMAYAIRTSPDGRYLAVNSADKFVRVFRASGGEVSTLKADGTPVWSPDSKSFLCTGRTEDGFVTTRYDVESGVASVTALPSTESVSDWSQDGAWLALVSSRHDAEDHTFQVYLRTPDGSDERRVPTGGAKYALRPRFSSDGKQMLFVVIDDQVGRIGILDLSDQQVRLIPGEWDGTVHACWSPDGTALAVKTSQTLGIVDVDTGRYDELEIDMPLRAGRLARLANGDLSAIRSDTPMFIGAVEWLKP